MIGIIFLLAFSNVWLSEARLIFDDCFKNQDCAKNEICLESIPPLSTPEMFCRNKEILCDEIRTRAILKLQIDKYVFERPSGNSCSNGSVKGKFNGEPVCCAKPITGIAFEVGGEPVASITEAGAHKLCSSDGAGCDTETEFCTRFENSLQSSTYGCFQNSKVMGDKLRIRGTLRVCQRTEDCQDEELCFKALEDGSGFCVVNIIPYSYASVISNNLKCAQDPLIDQLAIKSGRSSDFFESFQIAETVSTRVCIIREAMEEACGEPAAVPVKKDGKFMNCTDDVAMAECASLVNKTAKGYRAFCGNFDRCCKTNLCPGTLFPMAGECGSRRAHCQRYGWCLAGLCCPHYPLQGTYCSVAKAADVKHQLPVWTFNLTDGSLCSLGHYTWYREKFELRDTCSRELTCPEEDEVCVRTHSVPAWGGTTICAW